MTMMSHFLKITETDTAALIPTTVVAHEPISDAIAGVLQTAFAQLDQSDAKPGDGALELTTDVTVDKTIPIFGFKWHVRLSDTLTHTIEVTDEAPAVAA